VRSLEDDATILPIEIVPIGTMRAVLMTGDRPAGKPAGVSAAVVFTDALPTLGGANRARIGERDRSPRPEREHFRRVIFVERRILGVIFRDRLFPAR